MVNLRFRHIPCLCVLQLCRDTHVRTHAHAHIYIDTTWCTGCRVAPSPITRAPCCVLCSRHVSTQLSMPMQVVTLQNPALDAPLLGSGEPPMLAELQALAQRYAHQRTRAELGQAWRPGLLRLHKLMASLEAWLGYCPAKQRRRFLQSLQPMLQSAWGLHPPPVQVAAPTPCCPNAVLFACWCCRGCCACPLLWLLLGGAVAWTGECVCCFGVWFGQAAFAAPTGTSTALLR